MCGLAWRFRCRGHVRRPQMSEQKTEPSLDRPRDGSSTRHSSNWLGLWADDINSTLSPRPVAAAGCFFGRSAPARGSPLVSGSWLLWPRQCLPAEPTRACLRYCPCWQGSRPSRPRLAFLGMGPASSRAVELHLHGTDLVAGARSLCTCRATVARRS